MNSERTASPTAHAATTTTSSAAHERTGAGSAGGSGRPRPPSAPAAASRHSSHRTTHGGEAKANSTPAASAAARLATSSARRGARTGTGPARAGVAGDGAGDRRSANHAPGTSVTAHRPAAQPVRTPSTRHTWYTTVQAAKATSAKSSSRSQAPAASARAAAPAPPASSEAPRRAARALATGLARGGRLGPPARRPPAALAPPRAQDHARVAQAVEGVAALLALAGHALVHDDRTLGDAVPVEDGAEQKLRSLILRLLLAHRRGQLGHHRPQAA